MNKITVLYLVISFCGFLKAGELITRSGDWHEEMRETTLLTCISYKQGADRVLCQKSENGTFYLLSCPSIDNISVELRFLEKSAYCYASKQECISPQPCALLEKVSLSPGLDHCQRAEVKKVRKCKSGYTYRIDHKPSLQIDLDNIHISDKCCRVQEIFARPGVSRL